MPLINTMGGGSKRVFGGGGGGGSGIYGRLQAAPFTISPGQIFIFDCTLDSPSQPGFITLSVQGGAGGANARPTGYGAYVRGSIPLSILAGKKVAFVCGGVGVQGGSGRGSSSGGGFSGLVILDQNSPHNLVTNHILSAGGGGGSTGNSDTGIGTPPTGSTVLVYTGSPSGGLGGLAKSFAGTVARYPTLSYAARHGNAYGGGDYCSREDLNNNFPSGGGGGFGILPGGSPSNVNGPGVLGGNPAAAAYFSDNGEPDCLGGFGGGGGSSGGGNGSVPWRVCSGGGGGGGFIGGAGGGYTSDGVAAGGYGGASFIGSADWLVTFLPNTNAGPSLSYTLSL